MSWSDAPLSIKDQDLYEMTPYARGVARRIEENHSWSDSNVFGLLGAWGSGKSSILNIIEYEIKLPPTNWKTARFTPWATGDELGMLDEFYSSICSALPEGSRKNFRAGFSRLLEITAPMAAGVPTIGGVLSGTASVAANFLKRNDPWNVQFNEMSEKLRHLGSPLLIIADDIDRLDPEELIRFFKAIRLLGRFPGVNYLISYDMNMIVDSLSAANLHIPDGRRAVEYMEKIVQFQFDVPPLTRLQVSEAIDSKLRNLFEEHDIAIKSDSRYRDVSQVYLSRLTTPRAIERYIQQLKQALEFFDPAEVDIDDVLVMTLLRVVAPTVYSNLSRYSHELTRGHTGELERGANGFDYKKFDYNPLLEGLAEPVKDDVEKLLHHLFPRLTQYEFTSPRLTQGRRVSNPSYFDRFFSMGILSHDISDVFIEVSFANAVNGDYGPLREILRRSNEAQVDLALEKISLLVEQGLADEATEDNWIKLVECLLGVLPMMSTDGGMLSSHFEELERITIQSLVEVKTVDGMQKAFDIMEGECDLTQQLRFIQRGSWMKQENNALYDLFSKKVEARIHEETVNHFLAKDEAPADINVFSFLLFLVDRNGGKDLRDELTTMVQSGRVEMRTIASRCVSVAKLLGVKGAIPEISDFDQVIFDCIAPNLDDELYYLEAVEVDKYDITWANREKFVQGKIERPSSIKRD